MIAKRQRGHCFYDQHCSGNHARIMTPARSQLSLPVRTGHRFLFLADCSCWLKRDTKINLLPIADAALHATGIVGCRANSPGAYLKWIVVLRAPHSRCRKTGTDLESFCRRYAEHRLGQISLELVENRFTEPRRDAADDAFNDPTNRITLAAHFLNKRDHLIRRRGVRATNNILLNILRLHSRTIDLRNDFMNLRDVSNDLEFCVQHRQYFLRNCASCDSTNGLPRRSTAAALPVSNSVLGLISEIGV